MTIRVSTKFKERILGSEAFTDIFNGGRIHIYSGAQPANADAAATGTLLATVTKDGLSGTAGGLVFQQSGIYVNKATGDDWILVPSTAGIAGWFRLVGSAEDTGGLSYAVPRIDGSIGTDMVLDNTALVVGTTKYLQQFIYTIAPLGV